MKFLSAVSLFSVALLSYLTYTQQSSAPSDGENSTEPTVVKSSVVDKVSKDKNCPSVLESIPKNDSNSTIPSSTESEQLSNNSSAKALMAINFLLNLNRTLLLDLRIKSSYLPHYTEDNFRQWDYSTVNLRIDEHCDLSLVEKAFLGKNVIKFDFDLYPNHNILFEIFEIIKNKQFNTLTLYSIIEDNKYPNEFIRKLGNEISFWGEMERLNLWGFKKSQIIIMLNILSNLNSILTSNSSDSKPLKLKTLMMVIDEIDDESIGQLEIPSVEELHLQFDCKENYKQEIEDLLPAFPNLKKLDFTVDGELEYFEIGKNSKLETIEIHCKELKNEDKFVKYLKERTNLSSFHIEQPKYHIKWNKVNNTITKKI